MGSRGPAPKAEGKKIEFRPGVPPPPPWLDALAKLEYARAAEEIEAARGSLQQVDMALLSTYATAYSDVARLTAQVREEGEVVSGPQGLVLNPTLRALAMAQRTLLATTPKLGFSPADRNRLPAAPEPHGPNSFRDV